MALNPREQLPLVVINFSSHDPVIGIVKCLMSADVRVVFPFKNIFFFLREFDIAALKLRAVDAL